MSNLSELDALMNDLDSARRSNGGMAPTRVYSPGTHVTHSFSKQENTVTMTDRSSPLQDRTTTTITRESRERSESPLITRPKSPGPTRRIQPSATSPRQAATSGATQELDDLMASLNDFKVAPPSSSSNNATSYTEKYSSTVTKRTETSGYDSMSRDGRTSSPINKENWNARPNAGSPVYNNINGSDTVDRAAAKSPLSDNYCAGCDAAVSGQDCRQPFENGSFFDLDGRPYCEQHYHANRGSVCGTCQKPISGRCITAMGKKFHPDHFVCSYCVRPLNKGTFKEHNSKPWCHNCFERLFGTKKGTEDAEEGHADM